MWEGRESEAGRNGGGDDLIPGSRRGEEGSIHPEPSLDAAPSPLLNPILLSLVEFTPPWPLEESLYVTWETLSGRGAVAGTQ